MFAMNNWITRLYSFYAISLLTVLLTLALIFYLIARIILPYRQQIKAVYTINSVVMHIWAPLVFLRFKTTGESFIQKNQHYIVIMNHVSLLDMFCTAHSLKVPGKPLIKKELLHVPVLGWIFSMASIPVIRESATSRGQSYQNMAEELNRSMSLLIFPEGTRNRSAEALGPFRGGAFRLAVDCNVPILPAVMLNTRSLSIGGSSVLFRPGRVVLEYLPPVHPADFGDSVEALRDHCFAEMKRLIAEKDPYYKNISS